VVRASMKEPPGRAGCVLASGGGRKIIRPVDDGGRRARQAPAIGARALRTAGYLHRPSGWRAPGILLPGRGIPRPNHRTGARLSVCPIPW
jgi:hypothetical protein